MVRAQQADVTTAPAARPQQIPALDGLRGLAILMVGIYHFSLPYSDHFNAALDGLGIRFVGLGFAGVDLFFVLSGFLITGILLDTLPSENYFQSFYGRRLLRIFPLYYAFLALWFWCVPWIGDRLGRDWTAFVVPHLQWWHWSYLQNVAVALDLRAPAIGHLWSLAVEEQFYLAWPIVVFLVRGRRTLVFLCLSLALLAVLFRVYLVTTGVAPEAIYCLTPARMDALLVGGALAVAHRSGRIGELTTWARWVAWFGGISLIVGAGAGWLGRTSAAMQTGGYSLLAIFFGSLLVLSLERGGGLARAFSNRPLRDLGKYSYAVYIFHWPIAHFGATIANRHGLFQARSGVLLFVALGLACSYLAARVSWWLLEARLLALKGYFSARLPASQ